MSRWVGIFQPAQPVGDADTSETEKKKKVVLLQKGRPVLRKGMDDNLAQLFAHGEAQEREQGGLSDVLNPVGDPRPIARAHSSPGTRFSELRRGYSEKGQQSGGRTLGGLDHGKLDLFTHAESTPNLFAVEKAVPQRPEYGAHFEYMYSDPHKHDEWGILDENFALLFAYSSSRSSTTAECIAAPSSTPLAQDCSDPAPHAGTGVTETSRQSSRQSTASTEEAVTNSSGTSPKLEAKNSPSTPSLQEEADLPVRPSSSKTGNRLKSPKYAGGCCEGWSTEEVRKFWFAQKGRTPQEANKAALPEGMSLVASPDPNEPIYHWQLFSVMGADRIGALCRAFYENVYHDDDDLLKKVFQRLPGRSGLEHHVRAQTAFWIDAFGGGRKYAGGWERVEFHHRYGAGEILNTEGATRWAYHMNRALLTSDLTDDPRVKTCLCEFLKGMMDRYGEKFKFDTSNIKFGDSGLRGAVKSLNRAVSQASSMFGSWTQGMFSKSKDMDVQGRSGEVRRNTGGGKKDDGKGSKAKGRWALVRSAVSKGGRRNQAA